MTTLADVLAKITKLCEDRSGSTNFELFDKWMRGQDRDPNDMTTKFYMPDLRVAFIYGMFQDDKIKLLLAQVCAEYQMAANMIINDSRSWGLDAEPYCERMVEANARIAKLIQGAGGAE